MEKFKHHFLHVNLGMREPYLRRLREAVGELKAWSSSVVVIFHDDADGLCSGAIASLSLDKLGIRHDLICVEKVSPEIVKLIHSLGDRLYLYVDIGSGRADLIEKEVDSGHGKALIADHHDPVKTTSENVIHLNPELYGYSGEADASGSTATYLLMREACDVKDAAWLAVVGSAEIPGSLKSLNRIPLEDAVELGDVKITGSGESEKYMITFLKKPWNKLSSTLTAIGSTGYYKGGPYEAVKALKSKRFPEDLAKHFEELRRKKISQAMAMISRKGLNSEDFIQWFHLGDFFKGLGSKTVGTLASILSFRRMVDQQKYLIGFMNFDPEIPGLGRLEGNWVKVSVRAPKPLSKLIERGEMPPVSDLTVKAAEKVGGSGDGHKYAASALIRAGKEKDFLEEFNNLVKSFSQGR